MRFQRSISLLLERIEARRRVEFTGLELAHGAELAALWRRLRWVAPVGEIERAMGKAYWSPLIA
jgi:hypothetical protein